MNLHVFIHAHVYMCTHVDMMYMYIDLSPVNLLRYA